MGKILRLHNKSRRGCQSCKSRKIKCQETRPACANCQKSKLQCVYVSVTVRCNDPTHASSPSAALERTYSSPDLASDKLGDPMTALSPHDLNLVQLRLLHHFICYARPNLPVGQGSVWATEVPARAYHYPFLMHALLGLAASHLRVRDPEPSEAVALTYRQRALCGVAYMLDQPVDDPTSIQHRHHMEAVLAASYILAFQAQHMENALEEFILLFRGCGTISCLPILTRPSNVEPLFSTRRDNHMAKAKQRFVEMRIDHRILDAAMHSLAALEAPCQMYAPLARLLTLLHETVSALSRDSWEGYMAYSRMWFAIRTMAKPDILYIIHTSNPYGAVVRAHWLSLGYIFAPLTKFETPMEGRCEPVKTIASWIDASCQLVGNDPELIGLIRWPLQVVNTLKSRHIAKGWLSAADLADIVRNEPELFT